MRCHEAVGDAKRRAQRCDKGAHEPKGAKEGRRLETCPTMLTGDQMEGGDTAGDGSSSVIRVRGRPNLTKLHETGSAIR